MALQVLVQLLCVRGALLDQHPHNSNEVVEGIRESRCRGPKVQVRR